MILHTLYGGRSKSKMVRLETNSKEKCERYRDALKVTANCKYRWFEIKIAAPDEELKVHRSQNAWTGYNQGGPKITKGKTRTR
jgi:hypothetical protein